MQLVSKDKRKARKLHGCNFCGGIIQKGEVYYHSFIVDGGESWAWNEHEVCADMADNLDMYCDNNCDEGLDAYGFMQYIRDYVRTFNTNLDWFESNYDLVRYAHRMYLGGIR